MDELNQFVVVEFIETSSVSTVCKTWIISEHECYWPDRNYKSNLVKANLPDTDSWEKWEIRILDSCVDVKAALMKERKAQVTSDLATTDTETANKKKRRRQKPQKLMTSDSGSSSEDDLPPFNPKYELKRKRTNSPTATTSSQNPLKPTSIVFSTPPSARPVATLTSTTSKYSPRKSNSPRKSKSFVESQLARMQGQINSIETTVLQNKICLNEILELLRERCSSSLNYAENQLVEDSSTLEKKFPMKSLDEVMQLENQLLNEDDILKQMKVYLRRIGGKTTEDMTRRILTRLFTDGAAREFSWEGRGGKKRSLKELNLIKLIGRVISTLPSFDLKTYEKTVSDWFRQSGTRIYVKTKTNKQAVDCTT